MKKIFFLFLIFTLFQFCAREDISDTRPGQPKCNNLENPAGTDNAPEFSWIILSPARGKSQSAWQIILDQDPDMMETETSCFWNSGKVSSDQTSWIKYSGPSLQPATQYFWRIRFWDGEDRQSEWSESAHFITGLFKKSDWHDAKWIGYEEIPDSLLLVPGVHGNGNNLGEIVRKRTVIPYFRKEFITEKKIKQALVFVSGLGHYELRINGEKTGDRFLSPGWTNYLKICFYNTFNVTGMLKAGPNAIGVIVGNGFYNINRERYRKLVIAYGAPKLILKLRILYNDGSSETIVSDESWKTAPSPVTFTSIYGGEDYDAELDQPGWDRKKFDDSLWKNAIIAREPGGVLKAETDYPVRIMETFEPVSVINPDSGKYVYDFGQNASGIISIKVYGTPGNEVRFIPGELTGDDSLVTQRASGGPYYFSYRLKGEDEETWTPRFTYYGFRYIQAEGAIPEDDGETDNRAVISDIKMLHTRNSSPENGSFRCSNDLFNSIYKLIDWSIKSNLASVATDCPHREKLGWLEQTHLMGNSIKYVYDIHNLYDKVIDDMIEAQLDNGLVPDIAPEFVPFVGGFRDSPEWGSACVILPWDMYEWYGDIEAVKKAYPMMKKYVNYLKSMSADNILSHGLGDWYDLGPRFPGEAQLTPKEVTATSIWYYDAKLLGRMASIVGENGDAHYFDSLAVAIRTSFNAKFFDPKTKVYSTGSQTAYAMPLFFRMVDDSCRTEVVNNLVNSIRENKNALTAGDIGFRYLLRVLEEEGHSQVIFDMTSGNDVPGYGFQLLKGATSLTESWAGLREVSNNHMMLGHLMEWFYSGLGGIRQFPGSNGYDHILIQPEPVGDIKWAETTCRTIHGEILCSWKISKNSFILKLSVPHNCIATVAIPQSDPGKITEGGSPLSIAENIDGIESSGNRTFIKISSGNYAFRSEY
jgi:hypothetical protein